MDRALKEGDTFDDRLTKLAEKEVTPALVAMTDEQETSEESARSGKGSGSQDRASRLTNLALECTRSVTP
jgi:hypothetical protein